MKAPITIAAGGFAPRWYKDLASLRDDILGMVADANADLVVFPEYAAMAAALIGEPNENPSPLEWAKRGAAAHDAWVRIATDAASQSGAFVLAGSGPAFSGQDLVNRSVFCAPDGTSAYQDKIVPTPWERSELCMAAGKGLTVVGTPFGKVGIVICYDCEFPLISRSLAEAGAEILLVPSCTDTQAGQDRVRVGARARALENQCLVVQAPLIGNVVGCHLIDVNVGQVGFFGPPDTLQPAGGIHADGEPDKPNWVRCFVNLAGILATRHAGHTAQFEDWERQNTASNPVKFMKIGK